ncbi:hypothetical protein HKD37_10G027341 [Glycine soja]
MTQDFPQPLDLSEDIIGRQPKPAARTRVPLPQPWQDTHPMKQVLTWQLAHVPPYSHLLFAYHALSSVVPHLHRRQRHHRRRRRGHLRRLLPSAAVQRTHEPPAPRHRLNEGNHNRPKGCKRNS